jgi:hypothetical protein
VAGPDNAAAELVSEGENGAVAASASPAEIAAALLRVLEGGRALRASTAAWFGARAESLGIDRSLELVLGQYRRR